MKNAAGTTAGLPATANGLLAYVPPLMLLVVRASDQSRSPRRSSLPAISPLYLKPRPTVLTLSTMSVPQFRHGSILAFVFLSITVVKQPPETTVLPATPPTVAVFVIAPELYDAPAVLVFWFS